MIRGLRATAILAIVAVGLLVSCSSRNVPAPISDRAPPPKVIKPTSSANHEEINKQVTNKIEAREDVDHAQGIEEKAEKDIYIVKKGDTLFSIATEFGVDFRDIAKDNSIENIDSIGVGQKLKITQEKSGDSFGSSSKEKTLPAVEPKKSTTNKSQSSPLTTVWRKPVDGEAVYRFNQGSDEKARGIGFKVSSESPVFAVAPGKIVYSGSGLRGYGKLIIVKHDDVFLSVYAHVDRILGLEGQVVAQGQQIAIAGGGREESSIFHFEVREKGRPIDPSRLLSF
ncbi:MAG: peptidoglycan DD-metalloendopeptidase family protein [Betaproteobacteria bacterium]